MVIIWIAYIGLRCAPQAQETKKKSFSSSYFKNKNKMGTEGKRLEIGRVDSSGCEILAEPNDKRRRRRRKKKKNGQRIFYTAPPSIYPYIIHLDYYIEKKRQEIRKKKTTFAHPVGRVVIIFGDVLAVVVVVVFTTFSLLFLLQMCVYQKKIRHLSVHRYEENLQNKKRKNQEIS